MKLLNIIIKLIHFILLLCFALIKFLNSKTIESIQKGEYTKIYFIYGFVSAFLTLILQRQDIVKTLLAFGLIFLQVFIFRFIRRTHTNLEQRFYYLMGWNLASFYYIYIISILLIDFTRYTMYFALLFFLGFLYYAIRFLLYRWVRNWFIYSLVFFFMPLISGILWTFIGVFLSDLTKNSIYNSDFILGWMVLILSIFIMNLVIYWTPIERIDEVKVATYFLLAVFSTISYSFFISDYLATFIIQHFINYPELTITEKDIKIFIEGVIKWGSLPYLIGSVFACFSVELVCRNYNKQIKAGSSEVSKE